MITVGVIADTHGLLRPQAVEALQGSDLIIHAGDIGADDILERLSGIAELVAIRGNIDKASWAQELPNTNIIELAGKRIYVLHNLKELDFDPVAEQIDVVVSGHSHKPKILEENGVLYLNPGSAGPRRFSLPVAIAKLYVNDHGVKTQVHELDI